MSELVEEVEQMMGGADGVWSVVSDEWTLPAGEVVVVEIAEKKELTLILIELQRERDSKGGINERIKCISYN